MKIKIPKFDSGGSYIPPFATFTPVARPTGSTGAVSSLAPQKSNSDLTDKDILKMLNKMDGLPSDMMAIQNTMQSFLLDNTADPFGMDDTSGLASRYMSLLTDVKIANYNKKEYDNAYSAASSNNALNELAITQEGAFICLNSSTGQAKYVTPAEMKTLGASWKPLTNSDLLYRRANDGSLAYENSMLPIVQGSVSMDNVTKLIDDAIKGLGSAETKDEGYFYSADLITGYKDYLNAINRADATNPGAAQSLKDLYKYGYLRKDQYEKARKCIDYIFASLPKNAQSLILSKVNFDENKAEELIEQYVFSKTTSNVEFNVTNESLTKQEKSSSGSDSDPLAKRKMSILEEIGREWGGVDVNYNMVYGHAGMTVQGRQYTNLYDRKNNKYLRDMPVDQFLQESGIGSMYDPMGKISYGKKEIDYNELNGFIYFNSPLIRTVLPTKSDGSVNFDLLEVFEKALTKIKDEVKPDMTDEQQKDVRKKIFKDANLDDLILDNGELNPETTGQFILFTAFTSDTWSTCCDKESDYDLSVEDIWLSRGLRKGLREVTDSDDKKYRKNNTSLGYVLVSGGGFRSEKPEYKTLGKRMNEIMLENEGYYQDALLDIKDKAFRIGDRKHRMGDTERPKWGGTTDHIYSGTLFIPVSPNYAYLPLVAGMDLTSEQADELELKYQQRNKEQIMGSTSSATLNQ